MVSGGGAGPPQVGGERPRNGRKRGRRAVGAAAGAFIPPVLGLSCLGERSGCPPASASLRGAEGSPGGLRSPAVGGIRGCLALEPTPGQFRLVGVAVLELRVAPPLVRRYSLFLLLGSSIHIKPYFRFFYFPFITN